MTSTVKNIKVGNTSYPVQDTKATPFLSSTDEATLLSNGTYRGDAVANGTIFTKPDGTLSNFTKPMIPPTWISTSWSHTYVVYATHGTVVMTSGASYGDLLITRNGGSTWSTVSIPSGGSGNGTCYHKGRWYNGNRYMLRYSENDGVSWTTLSGLTTNTTGDITRGSLFSNGSVMISSNTGRPKWFDEANNAWVDGTGTYNDWSYPFAMDTITNYVYTCSGTAGATIGKSSDCKVWNAVTVPVGYGRDVAAYNDIVMYAADAGLYCSTNGGSTWTKIDALGTNIRDLYCLNGTFMARSRNATTGDFLSTDGLNWTKVSGTAGETYGMVCYNGYFYTTNKRIPAGQQYDYTLTPLSYTAAEVDAKAKTYEAGEGIALTHKSAGQENFTRLGSPTITNKVVSNISEVNQLTIPALTDGPCSTFEVTSVITRTASVDFECCFSSGGKVQLFKYTMGTSFGSWVLGVSDQVTSGRNSVNTTYWVKAVLSASNYKCYCYPFTEGSTPPTSLSSWNLCCTITDSSALTYLRNMFSELVYITGNADPRYAAQYWHGSMNLNYTSIYIDGELKWTPYTTEANVISNTGIYLVGTTAPTTATAGSVGQRYLNTADNSSYVLTDYTVGQKNYTTSGTVAVNNYGVARFGSAGQIIPNQTWSYSGSPWAIEMKITTPQSTSSGNGVCLFRWGTTDCMIFYNNAGRIVACGWSTGSNPYVAVSTSTTYWVKVEYDGTNINLYVSTTSTFPTTPSASSSNPAYWPGNNIATCIGSKNGSEVYTGSIDLYSLKWYSNGVLVYSALTDPTYSWKQLINEDNLETALSDKQDTLTAGTGIAISSNNTISLTTPYEVVQTMPASPTTGKIYFVTGS